MKTRCWFVLLSVCLWVDPLLAETNSSVDLIEHFNSGQINWTRGIVTANAAISAQGDSDQTGSDMAFQKAVRNVYNTLLQLRIDHRNCGAVLFTGDRNTQTKIENMAAASKVLRVDKDPSGGGILYVQMNLYGGFAQYVLPPDIRQVQPIKPLNGHAGGRDSGEQNSDMPGDRTDPEGYTGLIVDARGTGAKPSMVPLLLDEKGGEVFGPAYVSREYAVQYGLCQYIRLTGNTLPALPRVAPKPLVVKGLKTDPPGSCRIIISNTDASRLRGSSSHLEFLKQCRVIIVLD